LQRIGFRLQVKKEMMDEYVLRHASVWPEMLEALSQSGWKNYSLFLDRSDGTLFGYFETPSLKLALEGMASKEINEKWSASMAPFFVELDGKRPDERFVWLEQVFFLH